MAALYFGVEAVHVQVCDTSYIMCRDMIASTAEAPDRVSLWLTQLRPVWASRQIAGFSAGSSLAMS